jgi:hypothetical protein
MTCSLKLTACSSSERDLFRYTSLFGNNSLFIYKPQCKSLTTNAFKNVDKLVENF